MGVPNRTPLEEALDALHSEIAKGLLEKIKSGAAVAADYIAAMRFLKDNNYDAVPGKQNPAQPLAEMVPFPVNPEDTY